MWSSMNGPTSPVSSTVSGGFGKNVVASMGSASASASMVGLVMAGGGGGGGGVGMGIGAYIGGRTGTSSGKSPSAGSVVWLALPST